ncbi:PPE domain-containing protein [Nocardia bovistercoris]|uniref:PPE domain-containing protein n=1 Tax=Nocardia bovistercoris TaxID=2785916 RepID=A0A931I830_9NOCA|nr:hypothetical protein [Nocardia bovistercoris]MBH0775831.1 hypothetical protein [Nocardia bovistercoris]
MREIPKAAQRAPHTRTDPDYAPEVEVFDNLTHREIHNGVQQLDPAAITAGQQVWQGSATGVADAVAQAHTEIRSLIADGWRGGAAEHAAGAVRAFEQDGQRLADVMATVAQRLGQAGDAAETLRAAVGAPSEDRPDLGAALLDPSQATANTDTQKAAENARQDAVAAMDSIYTNAFVGSGAGVPAFPDIDQGAAAASPTVAATLTAPTSTLSAPVTHVAEVVSPQHISTTAPTATTPVREESAARPESTSTRTAPAAAFSTTHVGTPITTETTAPAAAPTVPTAAQPAPAAPAPTVDRPVTGTLAASAPVTAASMAAPTVPGGGSQHHSSNDDDRKREDRRRDTTGDAVSGAGAGAFGGLMGGALAAADTARPGSGIGAPPATRPTRADEDDDDDLDWFDDDDLTFLEPADEPGELIGAMDPTTPPVVGEWTDLE